MYCINFFLALFLSCSLLSATEFTISSYNCGGLSEHYDYLRAVAMQKLMQERHIAEPEQMELNEKIQKLALKILFEKDAKEKLLAQKEWNGKNYQRIFENLTTAPSLPDSPNQAWQQKADRLITTYKVRPVVISDAGLNQLLDDHIADLTKGRAGDSVELLQATRAVMAQRIFHHHLTTDIICLQEADYLAKSFFPEQYEVLFSESTHSINGLAWNKERFELVEVIGNIMDRAFAVQLMDKETNKSILVAASHITGCNPYSVAKDATGKADSEKGDQELRKIIEIFDERGADLMLIGMDANVTSLHPRMNILKEAHYQVDCKNSLEMTCTNPYQVLNTRIDWIALKTNSNHANPITNIPVLSVGLNNMTTNISDHKPIAAKIRY